MHKQLGKALGVFLLLNLFLISIGIQPAQAAGIVVNTATDENVNNGSCSLREAITAANTDSAYGGCPAGSAGADTITFAGNYTITLGGTQLPVVTTQVTINGNGTTNTDIRANASPNVATSRVFEVGATGNLTLSDLTVQNGRCAAMCATFPNDGGGIANSGTLTITFSRLESNSVTQNGGGIFNVGTLTITNSTFSSNTSSNSGGGIYNNDTLTVTNSTFNTNTAGDSGGGIFNGGFAMSITNSQFTQNSSSSGGGGIYNSSSNMNTVSITSSTFSNNSSNAGGGIYNIVGNLNITASSFQENSASTTLSGGGGIYNGDGMTITNSMISGNQALADNGGGITNDGTLTITGSTIFNNQALYNGGGVFNGSGSTLILANSFISNNTAANSSGGGGGIMNAGGTMNVTNSTIEGNAATDDGGGIHNNSGTATVTNSTISRNSANSLGSNGGGIYIGSGTFNLRNTIIANSVNGGDCVGSFASTSNNLIENASSACGLINGVNGNIIGSDPNLGSLTGSPEYLPLNTGSPAINAGSNAICAAVPVNNLDQRGVARPFGLNCDIGAYEYNIPMSLPAPWVGSVSVTSDKDLVSVGRPHIGSEVASYDGFSSGSTTAFVPMLFKDAFGGDYDAALYIQNVSGSSASVTIQYYDSSGVLNCTKADTIAPLASKGYWLPAATCDTGSLPTGWVGGVKVTSNHPIVAVGRPHIGSEVMTYNGFSSGSTSAFIPMLFKGAFGGSYNAAFYVQNVSGSSANVTLEYFDNTGTLNCTKSDTIASLASKGYWLPAATCDTGSLPAGWVGGVRVSSSQPVVTVGRPHIDTQITTYDGFSAGANSAFVPMLFKGAFGGSYNAAFYLQNVSNSSASVTIKYYDNAGTLNCTKADTIAPLASKGYWVPAATCDTGSLPAGWVGGVEVSSDQPIVSVGRPHIDAQVTTYNGFTAGATDVFLPMLFKDAFGGSYDSAFYLQNTEATAATVTIQFYDATGALTCSRSDTIQPRATLGFWVPSASCYP